MLPDATFQLLIVPRYVDSALDLESQPVKSVQFQIAKADGDLGDEKKIGSLCGGRVTRRPSLKQNKLGDAIAISNLKLSITDSLTH